MVKSKPEKEEKTTGIKRVWEEVLFWSHFLVIIAFIFCGLVVPLQVLVFLLIVWNIHLMILGRCIITIFQEKVQTPEAEQPEQPFIDVAYHRFTGKNLSDKAFDNLLTLIPTLALGVSLLNNIFKIT